MMQRDNLQLQWQACSDSESYSIDIKSLTEDICRRNLAFERDLWKRDLNEFGASVLVAIFFSGIGFWMEAWTLYMCAAGGLFVGVFLFASRWHQRKTRPSNDASLKSYAEGYLHQVRYQTWLLKNIFWWYLLPLLPGIGLFLGSLLASSPDWFAAESIVVIVVAMFCMAVFVYTYRLNKAAVEVELTPIRSELEQLLSSLDVVSEGAREQTA